MRVADMLDTGTVNATGIGPSWQLRLWGWLLLGLSAGLLGGTVRQVVWFVPLLGSGFLLLRSWSLHQMPLAAAPLAISGMAAFRRDAALHGVVPRPALFDPRRNAVQFCCFPAGTP